ncbi:response regulator transcription factor [Varunaivibrio sulfuroxidans]|uniref:Response regulator receiver domain-containing protein n=1 Tax=Varunaivibrio sulfuroxidans TaxID=1773489 RepID=A0A4R3J783_9PROT|nr:response regulator [Varunaivibrio sulfuroxidans]TCS61277.1 response regulator receiver domain-containing protein [Varunaivibrio sulfuroxidans]WES31105.1 response regulator [Varunaivibrio sulfuroxidans]
MAYSVLLVEDEPNIVLSLQFIMKQAGFDVRVATDGVLAIDALEQARADVVLLDIMLPKRDGFAVCEMIKGTPRWADVKVVMLSAKSRDADKERAKAVGADDFITKPFSTRELSERLVRIVENQGDRLAAHGKTRN